MTMTFALAYAADTSALDALEAKMEAKFEAKIDALQAEVTTLKNKADKVATTPLPRRRELWTSWQEVHDELQDKAEKITQGLRQLYINENLNTLEKRTIYEAGPIKYEVTCTGSRGIFLSLTLFNEDGDTQVFGRVDAGSTSIDLSSSSSNNIGGSPIVDFVLPQGEMFSAVVRIVDTASNIPNDGGVWANGYYVGYSGSSFLGLSRSDGLQVTGGNCQVAGVLNYFIPSHKDD